MSTDIEASESSSPYTKTFFPNSRQVWRICSNLKHLIDKVVSVEFAESDITDAGSPILNENVIGLVYKAAGGKGNGKEGTSSYRYQSSLVFCLLKVCDWYWQQAEYELYDTNLYNLRAVAAQRLAADIIERTENDEYLFLAMLCHRYTICLNDEDSPPFNVMELAVDMHSTTIIGSAGYQRCIKWLWRGWIVQSEKDPYSYELYRETASQKIACHFKPSRVKTPLYQNILEISFSLLYLLFFTIVLNTHQVSTSKLDTCEVFFYLFTLGSIVDECIKFYHVGYYYLGFWNVFNDSMYSMVVIAVGFRFASLANKSPLKEQYDEISFRVLSLVSPLMWSRLLLYLDAQKFVGAMIVVIKTMMKESLIFFVLLIIIILGFLQGFLGLDASDGKSEATKAIFLFLIKAVIGGSSFDDVAKLVPPYASILYYAYTFVLTVILMNILIALYSTAYSNIVENATDEYFALVAQKTLRYIRAPDQELYVPPLNLIEIVLTPLSWVVPTKYMQTIHYFIQLVIYSPILTYITVDELANARRVHYNRFKGLPDDANEIDTEWDLTDGYTDTDGSEWESLQNSNAQVYESLAKQRSAEAEDPEFNIDMTKFSKDIDEVSKPVLDANRLGIKWEYYEIYNQLSELQTLVKAVLKENELLKVALVKDEPTVKKEAEEEVQSLSSKTTKASSSSAKKSSNK
ncbi:Calcium channel yvc1 [Yamadazyma tenuis]|uniref:Vacuolar cation channel n=1 Tax=Candida tenuis (strain ATCC 10573 / BCRC 21748 / CBS 615 / JCM 9827 / NBRC 10315 / NRRL Y-1498 / VKM Y-70) TaxID=590646 RepID=G3B7V7_CANTC|nr:vacuolar cation channel [Yamadazyma tenuis ATCC 10573]EGV61666.1 vacuolar cation channel [Yamadazyma tenuis ATCC 10573]WEJ92894.1 Calcium channel yvc1 [Yamadazyma tenuis]